MDIITLILIIIVTVVIAVTVQVIMTRRQAKVSLQLKSEEIKTDQLAGERLYLFVLRNKSDNPAVVENVRMLSGGKEIRDNGHHPVFKAAEEDSDVVSIDSRRIRSVKDLLSENFLGRTVLQPKEEKTYSYYLDEVPDEIEVTVKENQEKVIQLIPDFPEND